MSAVVSAPFAWPSTGLMCEAVWADCTLDVMPIVRAGTVGTDWDAVGRTNQAIAEAGLDNVSCYSLADAMLLLQRHGLQVTVPGPVMPVDALADRAWMQLLCNGPNA